MSQQISTSKQTERKQITIYTDGACFDNPGPGGYGVVLLYEDYRKELSEGFHLTTNNRMEIMAAIAGLETLKFPCDVTIYTDSQYLADSVNQGKVQYWYENEWRTSTSKRVANVDLWKKLLTLCTTHKVVFVWIKGHAGDIENERCDELSRQAASKDSLQIDESYTIEKEQYKQSKTKISYEGQPCRKCSTPVEKKQPRQKLRKNQQYYFEYYFYCPSCQTMYMVEEAKRDVATPKQMFD